jgi:hypothetical protein
MDPRQNQCRDVLLVLCMARGSYGYPLVCINHIVELWDEGQQSRSRGARVLTDVPDNRFPLRPLLEQHAEEFFEHLWPGPVQGTLKTSPSPFVDQDHVCLVKDAMRSLESISQAAEVAIGV